DPATAPAASRLAACDPAHPVGGRPQTRGRRRGNPAHRTVRAVVRVHASRSRAGACVPTGAERRRRDPVHHPGPASFTDDLTDLLAHADYNGDADGGATLVDGMLSWSGPLPIGESRAVTFSV